MGLRAGFASRKGRKMFCGSLTATDDEARDVYTVFAPVARKSYEDAFDDAIRERERAQERGYIDPDWSHQTPKVMR